MVDRSWTTWRRAARQILRRGGVRRRAASRLAGAAGRRRFPPVQQHRRAGSASRSATRTRTAGPPKAGGTCRHAALRDAAARDTASRDSITSMRSTTTAAANGPARPSCARATRNSPCAASRIASRAATIAPASSRSIPASSRSWTVQLTEPTRQARPARAAMQPLLPIRQGPSSRRHRHRAGALAAMRRQRRTKIVATLGPASSEPAHDRAAVRSRRRRVPHQHEPHARTIAMRKLVRAIRAVEKQAAAGRSASSPTCRDRSCASAPSRPTR